MSGSKKGRKLGPYNTRPKPDGTAHVLIMSRRELRDYEWEFGPTPETMQKWLDTEVEAPQ